MSTQGNNVTLTDEAAGWVLEWRKLGKTRQRRLITACVLVCGGDSTVVHLLRSLRATAEPEAKACKHVFTSSSQYTTGTCMRCGERQ